MYINVAKGAYISFGDPSFGVNSKTTKQTEADLYVTQSLRLWTF